MNDINLVPLALNYYDKILKKNRGKFDKASYIRFKKYNDASKKDRIHMYDIDYKLMEEYDYEILGVLNHNSYDYIYWTWSWSIPDFKKKTTEISRNMLKYGWELDEKSMNFLKTELSGSRFRVTNPIQVDIHVALGVYLSKSTLVYKFEFDPERVDTEKDAYYPIGKKLPKNKPYQIYYLILKTPQKYNSPSNLK